MWNSVLLPLLPQFGFLGIVIKKKKNVIQYYLWFDMVNWKLTGSLAVLLIYVPFAKVLHKMPYVVIHSGLDVLGSLPLNDSQDVCEIHFCKCGFSPPTFHPYILPPLPLCLQIFTSKVHWIKSRVRVRAGVQSLGCHWKSSKTHCRFSPWIPS